jgi:hypothetical protein
MNADLWKFGIQHKSKAISVIYENIREKIGFQ